MSVTRITGGCTRSGVRAAAAAARISSSLCERGLPPPPKFMPPLRGWAGWKLFWQAIERDVCMRLVCSERS